MDATSQDIAPRLLTMPGAAVELGVSVRTLMRAIKRGELRCVRIGRSVRIAVVDLRVYVEARTR